MWVVDILLTICLAALTIGCAMTWRDLERRIDRLEGRDKTSPGDELWSNEQ